ncbi:MAG: hypothetical protein JST19_04175 [Bacteroidetes bacterium]|nr:hypothetical protein [Bacteroidota bacterium]
MKIILFLLCVMIMASCKKSEVSPYESQGTLIGYDMRMCPMCGGLEITIKNDTTKNPRPYYLTGSPLPGLNLGQNPKFPINVTLNWSRDTSTLGEYGYITVTKIKVIN